MNTRGMFEDDGEGPFLDGNTNTFSEEEEEQIDNYAILNVPREATEEDIHRAYKQRSLLFHPDRHLDERDRKEAAKLFVDLNNAYQTLIDPQQRKIYDVLGTRGIKMQGWQLVDRSATPDHIRREYEFLSRMRETERMLHRVNPTSHFMAKLTLVGCFQEQYKYGPELSAMNLEQSMDCALIDSHRIGLGGIVEFNQRGLGHGQMRVSHNWGPVPSINHETWLAARPGQIELGNNIVFSNLSPDSALFQYSLRIQPTLRYSLLNSSIKPSFTAMLITPPKLNWQGIFALTPMDSVSISLFYSPLRRPKFNATFRLSASDPFYSIHLAYHHYHRDSHWRLQGTFGFDQITPSLSYECRLSTYSRIALKIQFSYPACMLQASVKIKTSLSSYEFWLVFCDNQDDLARAFIQGVFLPAMAFNTARLLVRRFPIYKRFMKIFDDRPGEEMLNQARKEEAERVVRMLRGTAERIAAEEQQKRGLVIVEAKYGQKMLVGVPGADSYPLVMDVTVPLQALVNDSQLRLYSGKSQTPGFYDPCPGEPKCLRVLYRFLNQPHGVIILDDQPLELPQRTHRIQQQQQSQRNGH